MREQEQMVWAGQPRPGRFMRASIPMALFGIPFTAVAIFTLWAAFGRFSSEHDLERPSGFGALLLPLFALPKL